MNRLIFVLFTGLGLIFFPGMGQPYPMDGWQHTGIGRLEGLRLVLQGKIRGPRRVKGAGLNMDQVDIRLTDHPELKIPAPDPELNKKIRTLLGEDADNYSIAVLDLTHIHSLRYASVNGAKTANAGSVGKLFVALAVFQALADIYPDDINQRLNILRSTMVTADDFILYDHHKAPFWEEGKPAIQYRQIRQGDTASLWTYLDWMLSASSNAAAGMVQRELILMTKFGKEYPVSDAVRQAFFKDTPKRELGQWFVRHLESPLIRNGLDINTLRQGSFFTYTGKSRVPGTTSYACPDALVQFLFKLEKGMLVDTFSSREIKRLLYMTGKRIRYASSPALYNSAVYFKSGSLYKCRPEPGFTCRKYRGNVLNQLASVAIVEDPAKQPELHYIVAVMSNVLYKNSAVAHQTLATRLHRLIQKEKVGDKL